MIRFTKAKGTPKTPKKPKGGKKAALNKLKSFLTAAEPEVVEILVSKLQSQSNAVTYKELREAYLAGGITEKQFLKWQKDYSKLITSTLAPKWQEAAAAGAQEVQEKYPYFVYEPSVSAGMEFIKQHGAELVTNLAKEQQAALNAVIAHVSGYTAVTPDEAARIIRPCVGLTKPQALANAKYREAVKQAHMKAHPHGKEETAEKKAADAAARYAARQHRYWAQAIARTELAYAYNAGAYGATKDAQAQGYIGDCMKVWLTAYDERVCPVCSAMDEEKKKKKNMDEPFSNGKMLPPGHPSCRCAVAYEEIENTNLNPAPQNDIIEPQESQEQQAQDATVQPTPPPEPPDLNQPSIPPDLNIPDGMLSLGKVNLGGTGEMYAYKDADGNEWLFKPAKSKSGHPELFRAYSQKAGYKVQAIVDPDTAVPVGTGTLDGKFGAFQRRIDTVSGTDFKQWQHSGGQLPAGAAEQFQRESVTDWLLGNYDSHGGNFVTDSSGHIIGIDKEQSFKYIKQSGSGKLSYSYHPNAKYGETEPIYNTLYRKYADGEIDFDLQNTLKYIKRVEAIPDAEYREIFRDYAESLCGKGQSAEKMLDSILERKQNLRETFREFYTELEADKNGTAPKFQWADELAGTANPKQPKAAPLPGGKPKAKKPKKTEAKPVPQTCAPPATQAQRTESGYRMTDILGDASLLPQNQQGVAIRSDSGMVEGLNLTGRRINIGGSEYYEVSGKLTEEAWMAAAQNAKKRGMSQSMDFLMYDTKAEQYRAGDVGLSLESNKIMTLDKGSFEIYADYTDKKQYGMGGYFRVRVPATGNASKDGKAILGVFDKAGLQSLTADPTDADELLLKKSRIAWQRDPKGIERIRNMNATAREKEIDKILKKSGIDADRVQNMTLKEVFPGYSTYVDDAALMEYRKAGFTHIWAGVGDADSVVAITQSGGFTATNYRVAAGMKKCGASAMDDMMTGGSDNVFTRLGVNTADKYNCSFLGSRYRIIIDPAEMTRTDWYAYTNDNFGNAKMSTDGIPSSRTFDQRETPIDFIKKMTSRYRCTNEIMFRHGISSDKFVGISCETDTMRNELLDKFKASGVAEIHGVPIEDFVQTTQKIKQDCRRGLDGLDYYTPDTPF